MSGMRASPEQTRSASSVPAPAMPPVDAQIDHAAAVAYWSAVPATVDGMLGGYASISRTELQGSRNFLAKLRRRRALATASSDTPSSSSPSAASSGPWLDRAADCGAGIGRVTAGVLLGAAAVVDVVEPVAKFTDELVASTADGRIGRVWNVGLEAWEPPMGAYGLVWNQWCLGQLADAALAAYLRRAGEALAPGGWVVVKENMSTAAGGADLFDDEDSSVTRSEVSWKRAFDEAGLVVVAEETQRGLLRELYPVKMFALQPRR